MKSVLFMALTTLTVLPAFATPYIVMQTRALSAAVDDFSVLSAGTDILEAVEVLEDQMNPRLLFELRTISFDGLKRCYVKASSEFVADDLSCLPAPGGQCAGHYDVKVMSGYCEPGDLGGGVRK